MGARTLQDGSDIVPEEFYRLLISDSSQITTSAPRPQSFAQAFIESVESGKSPGGILCLTLSQNFSMAYQSAVSAADSRGAGLEDIEIQLIDTKAAAGSFGLIALAAARWAAAGACLAELVKRVHDLIPTVTLVAYLDTMKYLVAGGRVGKLQAWAGSKLNVKPVMELSQGEYRLLHKPRGRPKAARCLLDVLHQRTGAAPVSINVMHAAAPGDAAELATRIRDEVAPERLAELLVSEFTPVMGAHTGPGLLGLAFHPVYNGPSSSAGPSRAR